MKRLTCATAPTLLVLTLGVALLAATGHGPQALTVLAATAHTAALVVDTIARGIGYLSIVSLGVLVGLARAERRTA